MDALNQFELGILHWIDGTFRNPVLDVVMPFISFLGDAGWCWILISLVCLAWKPSRKLGLTMAFALLLSLLVANVTLKPLVARIRPFDLDPAITLLIAPPTDYAFPSGHTQASFASAMAIFCNHKKAGTAALVIAFLMGLSRLYLNVHFLSDVLAGAIFGIILGFLAYLIVRNLEKKGRKARRIQ